VDKHSLLLAPAERADVIVDFSQFAGKTLILYNDAPAAFPARVASYDYYTGAPDLSPIGAPGTLPGYGPNTRTIMQVKIAANTPAAAFNVTTLKNYFKHHADGSGVFEQGQHPIIVGQAAYNSAYGANFASSGNCTGNPNLQRCDGFVRVNDTSEFSFNTLRKQSTKMTMPLQSKAIHDEMNSTTFDEFGRMQATLGVEAQPPVPGGQNVVLYPFINPSTELIDATGLPKGDINVTPISSATDGTQIWRITHNGVDTHPIHFHLYDVQVVNRVTWDNIILPPEATELGWKDTLRISPLEDTIVALRPIIPTVPWELPNAIRPLSPMLPLGSTMGFNNVDPQGNPTNPILNALVNFGWEYVYHCHILSHEEMDMMRPVSVALPPNAPSNLVGTVLGSGNNTYVSLAWNDNSINETSFVVQRDDGNGWVDIATIQSPLDLPNIHQARSYDDYTFDRTMAYNYRILAKNTVGYGAEFPTLTVQSESNAVVVGFPPNAPTNLTTTLLSGPRVSLTFRDNANNETGFILERSVNGGAFALLANLPARGGTGNVTYMDQTVTLGNNYSYRVASRNAFLLSAYTPTASILVDVPSAPTNVLYLAARQGNNNERVTATWTGSTPSVTGYTIQWSTTAGLPIAGSGTVGAAARTFTTGNIARQAWYFRVGATNVLGTTYSAWFLVPRAP